MVTPVPRFSLRYIPKEFLGDIPKYKLAEKAPPSKSEWTLVAPKKRTPKFAPNWDALDGWVEAVNLVNGKREGWGSWKNTKTGKKLGVKFKDNMVETLNYPGKTGKTCDYCWDSFWISLKYSNGSFVSRSLGCGCGEGYYGDGAYKYDSGSCGYGCTCGTCLCSSAEYQWESSRHRYL